MKRSDLMMLITSRLTSNFSRQANSSSRQTAETTIASMGASRLAYIRVTGSLQAPGKNSSHPPPVSKAKKKKRLGKVDFGERRNSVRGVWRRGGEGVGM